MTDTVPIEDIERIVGVPRAAKAHYARAVSAEQTVYILHSRECLDSGVDLRLCRFSLALDNGIDLAEWREDWPVRIEIVGAFERTRIRPLNPDSSYEP